MKTADIVRRAARNLRRSKLRTLFTSLAIAVGAFTIMMSLAAGEGTRRYTENLIQSNVDPQSLFIVKDPSLFESGPQATSGLSEYSDGDMGAQAPSGAQTDIKPMTDGDVAKISGRDDIEKVQPIYQLNVEKLQFEAIDKQYRGSLTIYDPGMLQETAAGKLPNRGTDITNDSIVVPDGYAKELGIEPEKLLGKQVTVTIIKPVRQPSSRELTKLLREGANPAEIAARFAGEKRELKLNVAAVTKQSAMTFSNPTDALVSSATAETIYRYTTDGTDAEGEYFGITAKVKDGKDPMEASQSLKDQGYGVQTVKDLQSLIFTVVNVIQAIVAGFGVLALIASIFGIVNTMYISVLERTGQIGLMRALGMRARQVSQMFRYEAAWIGVLGGVIGILLALLAVSLLNPFLQEFLELGEGNYLLAFVWWQAGALLLGLIAVAIAAGYFPARKAAKLDPIEALRTE